MNTTGRPPRAGASAHRPAGMRGHRVTPLAGQARQPARRGLTRTSPGGRAHAFARAILARYAGQRPRQQWLELVFWRGGAAWTVLRLSRHDHWAIAPHLRLTVMAPASGEPNAPNRSTPLPWRGVGLPSRRATAPEMLPAHRTTPEPVPRLVLACAGGWRAVPPPAQEAGAVEEATARPRALRLELHRDVALSSRAQNRGQRVASVIPAPDRAAKQVGAPHGGPAARVAAPPVGEPALVAQTRRVAAGAVPAVARLVASKAAAPAAARQAPPERRTEPDIATPLPDAWRGMAPSPPPLDVGRLTDQVLQVIDQRIIARRERMGRS
jgi:hypothetical protein